MPVIINNQTLVCNYQTLACPTNNIHYLPVLPTTIF